MNKKIQPIVRLIDDDPTVLDSQSFFLRLCGWQTVTYSNAKDFLELDDLLHPGCVVLDVRMPGMTGLELQDEIIHRKIDLPIIFRRHTATLKWQLPVYRKELSISWKSLQNRKNYKN